MRFGKRTRSGQSAYSWGAGVGASLRNLWGTGALGTGRLVNGPGEGNNGGVWEPTLLGTFGDWDDVSTGGGFGMGIRNGKLYGWGLNLNGRNGQGLNDSFTTSVPTQVGTDSDWVAVKCGFNHSIALKGAGELWVWGSNANAKTGRFTTVGNTLTPTRVGAFDDATSIDVGGSWNTMIRDGGKLFTWGFNQFMRTGQNTISGNTTSPTQVAGFDDWHDASAGNIHGLAVRDIDPYTNAGKLYSWGTNSAGVTGQNTTTGNTNVPTQIGSDDDWVLISAGGTHSLATKSDGRVFSWGNAFAGQLGNGTTTPNVLEPEEVAVGSDNTIAVTQIYASKEGSFSAAIKEGDVYTCGQNGQGQLGFSAINVNVTTFTVSDASGDWEQVSLGSDYSLGLKRKRI